MRSIIESAHSRTRSSAGGPQQVVGCSLVVIGGAGLVSPLSLAACQRESCVRDWRQALVGLASQSSCGGGGASATSWRSTLSLVLLAGGRPFFQSLACERGQYGAAAHCEGVWYRNNTRTTRKRLCCRPPANVSLSRRWRAAPSAAPARPNERRTHTRTGLIGRQLRMAVKDKRHNDQRPSHRHHHQLMMLSARE
jgi:hypothetical protein